MPIIHAVFHLLTNLLPTDRIMSACLVSRKNVRIFFMTFVETLEMTRKALDKGRTIRNNRTWGDNSQKEIPARKTCPKNPASGDT